MLQKFCYPEPEPGAGSRTGAGQDWTGSTTLLTGTFMYNMMISTRRWLTFRVFSDGLLYVLLYGQGGVHLLKLFLRPSGNRIIIWRKRTNLIQIRESSDYPDLDCNPFRTPKFRVGVDWSLCRSRNLHGTKIYLVRYR